MSQSTQEVLVQPQTDPVSAIACEVRRFSALADNTVERWARMGEALDELARSSGFQSECLEASR